MATPNQAALEELKERLARAEKEQESIINKFDHKILVYAYARLEHENERLKTKIARMEDADRLETENTNLHKAVDGLRDQNGRLKAERLQNRQELEQYKSSHERYKSSNENLLRDKKSLTERIEKLEFALLAAEQHAFEVHYTGSIYRRWMLDDAKRSAARRRELSDHICANFALSGRCPRENCPFIHGDPEVTLWGTAEMLAAALDDKIKKKKEEEEADLAKKTEESPNTLKRKNSSCSDDDTESDAKKICPRYARQGSCKSGIYCEDGVHMQSDIEEDKEMTIEEDEDMTIEEDEEITTEQ